jgi:hypothetical protein
MNNVLVATLVVAGMVACGSDPYEGWGNTGGGPGPISSTGGMSRGGADGGVDTGGPKPDAGGGGGPSGGNGSSGDSGTAGSSGGSADGGGNAPACVSGVISHVQQGSDMKPGEACVSCHAKSGGPPLTIGGTVYQALHEPDDCVGVTVSGATVVITDANGTKTALAVDSVGNFSTSAPIATPYQAEVDYNGKTSKMLTAQANGDCNACHTESGASGAPGRIVLP